MRRPRSWRTELASIALLASLTLFAFWKYHVVGAETRIAQLQLRLAEVKAERAKASSASLRRQDVQAQVESLRRRFETMKSAFDDDSDGLSFIRQMDTVAAGAGVTVRWLTPQSPKPGPVITEIPLRIQLTGSYHSLLTVFAAMSTFEPPVRIDEVTLTGRELVAGDLQTATALNLTAHCSLSTFRLTAPRRSDPTRSAPVQSVRESREESSSHSAKPRDPFASPLAIPAVTGVSAGRPPGIRGVLLDEVALTGIVRDDGGYGAFLRAADKRTFIVRSGAKLSDAFVRSISADAITFAKTDATSRGSREIVKRLRVSGEPVAWSRR